MQPTGHSDATPNGDPLPADEIVALYAERLARLAERHLSLKLKGRVDGKDVVQSAFRTFFRRSALGEFRIDSRDQLWRLLVRITLMRVRRVARFHTAESRDVNAEEQASPGYSHEPDPAAVAEVVDQIERMLDGLPDLHGSIVELRLQGCSANDIADKLGVSRRTVYRALELLQERLASQAES